MSISFRILTSHKRQQVVTGKVTVGLKIRLFFDTNGILAKLRIKYARAIEDNSLSKTQGFSGNLVSLSWNHCSPDGELVTPM